MPSPPSSRQVHCHWAAATTSSTTRNHRVHWTRHRLRTRVASTTWLSRLTPSTCRPRISTRHSLCGTSTCARTTPIRAATEHPTATCSTSSRFRRASLQPTGTSAICGSVCTTASLVSTLHWLSSRSSTPQPILSRTSVWLR